MIDYTILYREKMSLIDLAKNENRWRIFVSAFNGSERVRQVFARAVADEKHWLMHPEYGYQATEYPSDGRVIAPATLNEAEFIAEYFDVIGGTTALTDGLCIDITGFMRPHLMFLVRRLFDENVSKFSVVYTDPMRYAAEEQTAFTQGPVVGVRQVAGFEGQHIPDSRGRDLLVIGTGYDHELIARVAEAKENAHKVQMFGLPSLQPDMYQENVLRAARAAEAVGPTGERDSWFAPANDPFATAQVLHDGIKREMDANNVTNVYLCPVGTKPQTLGFALFYLSEMTNAAASVIFPFAERYERETAKGIARIWKYTVERL